MTKDYIKYKNILHCRSCQHYMLMDEYTGSYCDEWGFVNAEV